MNIIQLGLIVLLVAGLYQIYINSYGEQYSGKCPENIEACYFKNSYKESKSQFIESAKNINANLLSFPIYNELDSTLSIDVAVIMGKDSQDIQNLKGPVFIHTSGTHGVEGYVGAGIQLAFLEKIKQKKINIPKNVNIVLIHALNPFGFNFDRRFNENNVDLNRNFLKSQEQFDQLRLNEEQGAKYYKQFNQFFNSREAWIFPFSEIKFLFKAIKHLIFYKISDVKKALVTGQYNYEDGIYFGGFQQQNSTKIMIELLSDKLNLKNYEEPVVHIDVHSGLGEAGKDTFMYQFYQHEAIKNIFEQKPDEIFEYNTKNTVLGRDYFLDTSSQAQFLNETQQNSDNTKTDVGQGYEEVRGSMDELFQLAGIKKGIQMTQEFGTMPNIYVLKSLIQENDSWFYGNQQQKIQGGVQLKSAFFIDSLEFKKNVLDRGLIAIQQVLQGLQNQKILEQIPDRTPYYN